MVAVRNQIIERYKIGKVQYRHFIRRDYGGGKWEVQEWRLGRALLDYCDGSFTFVFKGEAGGKISVKQHANILEVFEKSVGFK